MRILYEVNMFLQKIPSINLNVYKMYLNVYVLIAILEFM